MTTVDAAPSDVEWLGRAWGRWAASARWSAPGHTPSPAALERLLWDGCLVQQVVLDEDEATPVGLLQLAGANLDSGYASLELFVDPERHDRWEPALAAFVDRTLRDFPLRKLVLDLVPDEVAVPRCLAGRADLVGRLPRHERRGEGRYVDRCLYEIRADRWREGR